MYKSQKNDEVDDSTLNIQDPTLNLEKPSTAEEHATRFTAVVEKTKVFEGPTEYLYEFTDNIYNVITFLHSTSAKIKHLTRWLLLVRLICSAILDFLEIILSVYYVYRILTDGYELQLKHIKSNAEPSAETLKDQEDVKPPCLIKNNNNDYFYFGLTEKDGIKCIKLTKVNKDKEWPFVDFDSGKIAVSKTKNPEIYKLIAFNTGYTPNDNARIQVNKKGTTSDYIAHNMKTRTTRAWVRTALGMGLTFVLFWMYFHPLILLSMLITAVTIEVVRDWVDLGFMFKKYRGVALEIKTREASDLESKLQIYTEQRKDERLKLFAKILDNLVNTTFLFGAIVYTYGTIHVIKAKVLLGAAIGSWAGVAVLAIIAVAQIASLFVNVARIAAVRKQLAGLQNELSKKETYDHAPEQSFTVDLKKLTLITNEEEELLETYKGDDKGTRVENLNFCKKILALREQEFDYTTRSIKHAINASAAILATIGVFFCLFAPISLTTAVAVLVVAAGSWAIMRGICYYKRVRPYKDLDTRGANNKDDIPLEDKNDENEPLLKDEKILENNFNNYSLNNNIQIEENSRSDDDRLDNKNDIDGKSSKDDSSSSDDIRKQTNDISLENVSIIENNNIVSKNGEKNTFNYSRSYDRETLAGDLLHPYKAKSVRKNVTTVLSTNENPLSKFDKKISVNKSTISAPSQKIELPHQSTQRKMLQRTKSESDLHKALCKNEKCSHSNDSDFNKSREKKRHEENSKKNENNENSDEKPSSTQLFMSKEN